MDSIKHKNILKYDLNSNREFNDILTTEEPLEIRVNYHVQHGVFKTMSLAVTMRTPGEDDLLAKGFLFTEGIIQGFEEISNSEQIEENIILLTLRKSVQFDADGLKRNFYTTSSCGVCGKASIESIHSDTIYLPWASKFQIASSTLCDLPDRLMAMQATFNKTGGIHACALVDEAGQIINVKEDVGRHNAMDKLIGSLLQLPASGYLVLVSGRASFELVQKASKAGIPLLVAIGAPSSLAVELAEEQGMGLVGFLCSTGFNCYTGHERIQS